MRARTLCPARELVADRDKPAAGSVRAREISPALRALLMAKKPQCPSVFRLCESTAVCTCCLATVVSKRLRNIIIFESEKTIAIRE